MEVRFLPSVHVELTNSDFMERTRDWRRKKTQSVWKRRLKEHIDFALIPSEKTKTIISKLTGKKYTFPESWRSPSTWKEFKDKVKWSRYLRDQGRIQSDKSEQIEHHHDVKIERRNSKKLINEGIQEHDERYDEGPELDYWDWEPHSYDEIFK